MKINLVHFFLLFFAFASLTHAQELPGKIRGYKVFNAGISVTNLSAETAVAARGDEKEKSKDAQITIGKPEFASLSLTGINFTLPVEVLNGEQTGTLDFITFHDFKVGGASVSIEEYKADTALKKNAKVDLKKPFNIYISAPAALKTLWRESRKTRAKWLISGRVFVFGTFKKFGFSFKRVVPVDVNIEIENPIK